MRNKQKPLPAVTFDGTYAVHSMFLTIQGEGPFSGDAAVFVRLEGCNLQCPLCDTDYTGGARAKPMSAAQVLTEVLALTDQNKARLVVITGGEPFRQDLFSLVDALMFGGFNVQIETNGTMAPSEAFKDAFETAWLSAQNGVALIISPKANFVDPWIENKAIAYKYVLSHDSVSPLDGLPIEVLNRRSNPVARPKHKFMQIFIQPADPSMADLSFEEQGVVSKANHKAVIDSAIKFGYRAQLQIHKHFEVE